MKIITAKEKTTGKEYDIVKFTGYIFDYELKIILFCTDDIDAKQFSDLYDEKLTFILDDQEVVFYVMDKIPYETIKDLAEIIRIQDIEHSNYFKKEELQQKCSDCYYNDHSVVEEPCASCVNLSNYKIKNIFPTDPETLDNTLDIYNKID